MCILLGFFFNPFFMIFFLILLTENAFLLLSRILEFTKSTSIYFLKEARIRRINQTLHNFWTTCPLKIQYRSNWNTCQLHFQTKRNCGFLLKYRTRFLHDVSPKLFIFCLQPPRVWQKQNEKLSFSQEKIEKKTQIGHQNLLILLIFHQKSKFIDKIKMDLKSFLGYSRIFWQFLSVFGKSKSSLCFVSAWGLVVVLWCLLILIKNAFQDKGLVVLPTDRACIQNAPACLVKKFWKFSAALAVVPLALSRWSHLQFLGKWF